MNDKNTAKPVGDKKPENIDTRTPDQKEEDARWGVVKQLVRQTVPAIKAALPAGSPTDPERFAGLCLTVFRKDWADNLKEDLTSNRDKAHIWASDFSIQRCIVQAAELDLQPGSSLGQAFFIRYGYDLTFMIGVWGYVALMRRSDDIVEVWADVIYEKDTFRVVRGAHRDLQHEIDPLLSRGERGRVIGSYACVKYRDGFVDWEFVNEEDLQLARATSKAPNSPAHAKWPDEMRKRTALKRLAKYVDKCLAANRAADVDESDELREDLAEAIRTITVQGETIKQEVSKQKSVLDSIIASGGPALPPHVAGQSAREQMAGAQRQESEVAR